MIQRRIILVLVLVAGVALSHAYAEDNFQVDISPELQERLDFSESRIQPPDTNFGYRTIRLTVQPKQPGDRPVIWAKFYAADGSLLETVWNRIKTDGKQKCKFDYMDVQNNAVRVSLSSSNQE